MIFSNRENLVCIQKKSLEYTDLKWRDSLHYLIEWPKNIINEDGQKAIGVTSLVEWNND